MRTGGAEALAFDVACLAGPGGGAAARLAGRPAGARRDGPAVRLRGAGRRLPERHDPDAVRRRAVGARPRDLRARGARPGRRDRGARGRGRADGRRTTRCRAGGRSTGRARRHRRPPATARISGTARVTGSGWRRTRRRRSGGSPPTSRCRARPSSRSSPASISTGEMGVRIEDLVLLDAAAGRVERLTRFPREVLVVGG